MSEYRCVTCGSLNVAQVPETPNPNKHRGGRVPWGFTTWEGEYRFDPATGPWLANLLQWKAQGYTYRVIAQEANALCILTPSGQGVWSHSMVRRVVLQGKKLSHLIPLSYIL